MSNASKSAEKSQLRPPQTQSPPGDESQMTPRPKVVRGDYRGSGKLAGKVAASYMTGQVLHPNGGEIVNA